MLNLSSGFPMFIFIVHFVLTQNEPKNQEVFKELFASKTTAKSTLHASFRLYRNALPFDLQLVLRKLRGQVQFII